MSEHDELLRRFQPALRYDSNEQFFADSAAQFTDAPGITLRRRARTRGTPGETRASAQPAAGEAQLSLGFLGPKQYGSGAKVAKTDVIGAHGKNYRAQYVALRTSRRDLNNRIYGRAVTVNGRLWLQYWLWYFYNDFQLALGVGTHEGDWECVQLRMAPDGGLPDIAVYAQHRHGARRLWRDVEKHRANPDTPVVYVARGSHASYFQRGRHKTDVWYDIADGQRPAPALTLEIVSDATHPWLHWPGRWGDTTARDKLDIDQTSPTGPGTKAHWRNPDVLLDNARASLLSKPPRAPDVQVTRGAGGLLQLGYDFSDRDLTPRALVVTINSRNEEGVPPITSTFEDVADKPKGTIATEIPLHPAHHYDVYTSTVTGDPPEASESQLTLIDAREPERQRPFSQEVAVKIGKLFAKISGDG